MASGAKVFVNDTLLNESGMQNHPLTPLTDPDIRRWLTPQTKFAVGHVAPGAVLQGANAISDALEAEHRACKRLIVVDALRDADLMEIGRAADTLPLVTGGSGVALGLPDNFTRRHQISGGRGCVAWTAGEMRGPVRVLFHGHAAADCSRPRHKSGV